MNKFLSIRTSVAANPLLAHSSVRCLSRIPLHEYHIRFSPEDARKVPCQDVLNRFKRLNNGQWVRMVPGIKTRRYMMNSEHGYISQQLVGCHKIENEILDKLVTRFWTRPRYYLNDPYEPYHYRHGIRSPRVDDKGRLVRERRKILVEDYTAQKHFYDR